jgi:hypothetical protein
MVILKFKRKILVMNLVKWQLYWFRCKCVNGLSLFEATFLMFLGGDIREIRKVTLSSPCLWASFHPLTSRLVVSAKKGNFIKSRYEMLKLTTNCWISLFNAQCSRGVIVAVQVGAVKIYVAAVEALSIKEREDETPEMVFWVSPPLEC